VAAKAEPEGSRAPRGGTLGGTSNRWHHTKGIASLPDLPTNVPAQRGNPERHGFEGVRLLLYGPAKTVADCFKFRNKIGLDVAMEALRDYRRRRGR